MTAQAVVNEKYQTLFKYLVDKREEWSKKENGRPAMYIRKQGTDALVQELVMDSKFNQSKIVGIITSPTADEVFAVVNALASPYDYEWVFAADILRDAIMIAIGKKQRNKQLIAVGITGALTLLYGLLTRNTESV